MNILLTGGIGYIGSHTIVELLRDDNNSVVVIDNLVNSRKEVKDIVEKITGKSIKFYEGDLVNFEDIDKVFKNEKIDAVRCVLTIQKLANLYPWFSTCVRDVRMLRIEENNDLKPAIGI